MKTHFTSGLASGKDFRGEDRTQHAVQLRQAPAAAMDDARTASLAHLRHQEMASNSSHAVQLKKRAQLMTGRGADAPLQRVEDEELVQGRTAVQTAQLQRLSRVVGGMEIDLDTISDDALLATYKNYYMPSRDQRHYAQFGADIRAELLDRGLAVPSLDSETEWVRTARGVAKFGILLGYFYRPVAGHGPAGRTHYPDYDGRPNNRAEHVVMTERGVGLMHAALDSINNSKAQYQGTDESFTNVYVRVNGVDWGLHLGEERQIFPIAGQGLPDYFDS